MKTSLRGCELDVHYQPERPLNNTAMNIAHQVPSSQNISETNFLPDLDALQDGPYDASALHELKMVEPGARPAVHNLGIKQIGAFNSCSFQTKMGMAHRYQRKITAWHGPRCCGSRLLQTGGRLVQDEVGECKILGKQLCRRGNCIYCLNNRCTKEGEKIARLIRKATATGSLRTVWGTLTIRKGPEISNKKRLNVLKRAFSLFLPAKYRRENGIFGYCKVREIVVDDEGMNHPHLNLVFWSCKTGDALELQMNQLKARWVQLVKRVCSVAAPMLHCQFLQEMDTSDDGQIDRISSYCSKINNSKIAVEATSAFTKTGKGRTPFELLVLALEGDRNAELYFHEWQRDVYNTKKFGYSVRLEKHLDDWLNDLNVEDVAEELPVLEEIAPITPRFWHFLQNNDFEPIFLKVMSSAKGFEDEKNGFLMLMNVDAACLIDDPTFVDYSTKLFNLVLAKKAISINELNRFRNYVPFYSC